MEKNVSLDTAPSGAALLSGISDWQLITLYNRLDQAMDVHVQCRLYKGRFHVFLRSDSLGETRRIEKSAEYVAQQLVGKLNVDPKDVSFVLSQAEEPAGCWRWCFQWVGNSPLKPSFSELSESAQSRLMAHVVLKGALFVLVGRESRVA